MTDRTSPLRAEQEAADADWMPFGSDEAPLEVVQNFADFELEYGALRKGAGILDFPHRGVVEVAGGDRIDFLQRMLANDVAGLEAGQGTRSFLLSGKGRIVADLIVLAEHDRVRLVTDVFQAPRVIEELDRRLFAEEVALTDATAETWHLAALGPKAGEALAAAGAQGADDLAPLAHRPVAVGGASGLLYRRDETGNLGLHVLLSRDDAPAAYRALAEAVGGLDPDPETRRAISGRGVGWLAYNTARIEAGTPLFHVDFGTDSLPHETGIVDEAVSLEKGCYIGQEVVAITAHRGHPSRQLVGLRFPDERMPVAGNEVLDADDRETEKLVGAVTSSTLSPMLGHVAIAFAMVKWGKHQGGTVVDARAEGERVPGTVQGLKFLAE